MFIALFLLFIACLCLSSFEERLNERDKKLSYILLGIVMILIAGLRIPTETPDSESYELMYYGKTLNLVEPTFILFSNFLLDLSLGVNALFLTYAAISIPLRLVAIWKLSNLPLLTLCIYISHYYLLHDIVEMRCAVASALFLLAIYYRLEQKTILCLLCILCGFFFHFSALVGMVILFMNNKPIKTWQCIVLYLIIPIGIIFYFSGLDISQFVPSELGGEKLQIYRTLKEKGKEGELEGIPFYLSPAILLNICLYYGCLFYQQLLTVKYKYFPFFIKIMGIAFICKFTLGSISSVLASRLFEYFDVVSIFLWTASIYAFFPLNIGKCIVNLASTIRFLLSSLFYVLGLGVNH